MKANPIKIGIVGYGMAAQTFHIPLITASREFTLTAISSSQKGLSAKIPQVDIFATYQAMLAESDVELIIITTPNTYHFDIAKACLSTGKHVVIEKPMVTDIAQGEVLIRLANDNNCVLTVFHNRRWDNDFLTVKSLIDSGKLGNIKVFTSHFDRFRPNVRERWRETAGDGSGIWYDLGAHLVDQALVLFGRPTSISANIVELREASQTNDYFHVLLHYCDKQVVLNSSCFSNGPNQRFTVQGENATYVKQGLDPQEDQLKSGMLPSDESYGFEAPSRSGVIYSENEAVVMPSIRGCYLAFYKQLGQAITEKAHCPVTAEQALDVIRIIELAIQSSNEKRTISLSL